MQSAVLPSYIVLLSVCPSVRPFIRDTDDLWLYRLGYFKSNYTDLRQRWKWVSGSWVTASDPLTHDEITAQ